MDSVLSGGLRWWSLNCLQADHKHLPCGRQVSLGTSEHFVWPSHLKGMLPELQVHHHGLVPPMPQTGFQTPRLISVDAESCTERFQEQR